MDNSMIDFGKLRATMQIAVDLFPALLDVAEGFCVLDDLADRLPSDSEWATIVAARAALAEIARVVRKPNRPITNEWYWQIQATVQEIARAALTRPADAEKKGKKYQYVDLTTRGWSLVRDEKGMVIGISLGPPVGGIDER